MVLKKLIKAMLGRETKVIVPINCNAPEDDAEYIQIEVNEENLAE